jgi:hypothetical protein
MDPSKLRDPQDVERWIGDFFRPLYQHLESQLAPKLPPSKPWHLATIAFTFSVPLAWPEAMCERFQSILVKADFGQSSRYLIDVSLPEPILIAVYTSLDSGISFTTGEDILVYHLGKRESNLRVVRAVCQQNGSLRASVSMELACPNRGTEAIEAEFKGLRAEQTGDGKEKCISWY